MYKNGMYGILAVCALALFGAGCKSAANDTTPGSAWTENPPPAVEVRELYAAEFWGEWLCGNNGAVWYIAGGGITVNGEALTSGVTLAKQSARVIKVSDGGDVYYLYASRTANAAFTGRLAALGQAGGPQSAAVSGERSAAYLEPVAAVSSAAAGVPVKVTSVNNPALSATATTGSDGAFVIEQIIPGDTYKVQPEGGTVEIVTINNDGEDIGTITLTQGANFKMRVLPPAAGQGEHLFVNQRLDVVIEIENTGTENCTASTYTLECSEYIHINSGDVTGILGTIKPGMKKEIPLNISCADIPVYESLEYIYIIISDNITKKTWTDSVSFMFKKGTFAFNIKAEKPVHGVFIPPNARAHYFEGSSLTITSPCSASDFLIFFCGADAEANTETRYSFGVDRPAPDYGGFMDLGNYEPNDTEQTAARLTGKDITSYLHDADIDYYTFALDKITKEIRSFTLDGARGAITHAGEAGGTVRVTVPFGTSLTNRTVEITHNGAFINPLPGAPQDFNVPQTYTVTAEDGKTRAYTVTVTVAPNTACDITGFLVNGSSGRIAGAAITLTLPLGSQVTSLAPSLTLSLGARVSPASGEARNFTTAQTYTVTAASGAVKTYTVTVTVAARDAKAVTGFTVAGQNRDTVINEAAGTITLTLPEGTALTALAPAITLSGGTVSPSGGAAQDFSGGPVPYTVTAADGSQKTYAVTVTNANIAVTLDSVTANGSSWAAETTQLTLTFSQTMGDALRAEHIGLAVSGGITRGTLARGAGERVYTLTVSAIPANGAALTVSLPSPPAGYTVSGAKTVSVYKAPAPVTWSGLAANGADGTADTTTLTFTFNADMGGAFTAANITLSGASKGALSHPTATTYALAVSGITGNKASVSASLSSPAGWSMSGTNPRTVTVYKRMSALLYKGTAKVSDGNLAGVMAYISQNAAANDAYVVKLLEDDAAAPLSLSYSGKNVSITLQGEGAVRTIQLSAAGSLFTVSSGVTLTLDNNLTLLGRSNNTKSLITVNSNGILLMKDGATISGNTNTNTNTAYSGGGVYVNYGSFIMSGGIISNNTASSGGGVYTNGINGNTFTMSGGTISGNTADSGGGVCIHGPFTMSGGTISGNTATSGGGVYIYANFTMSGGIISDNTAFSGGGIYVCSRTFTMSGGTISGNTATSSSIYSAQGGGVYVYGGTFTMNGGTISGNTASSGIGGGVSSFGSFRMSGGVVYGSNAAVGLKNTAKHSGAALYKSGGTAQYGTYNGDVFTSKGDLATTDTTVRIVNGVLKTE